MNEPQNAVVVPPGTGGSVSVAGDRYTFKITGQETGGAYALLEALVPPGGGPPPHVHRREDEAFYVLDGEVTLRFQDRSVVAGAGAFMHFPRGIAHTFVNTGRRPAKILVLVTPSGLEHFLKEVGDPVADDAPPVPPTPQQIERMLASAPKYGIEIL